jgi:hypothetical protein
MRSQLPLRTIRNVSATTSRFVPQSKWNCEPLAVRPRALSCPVAHASRLKIREVVSDTFLILSYCSCRCSAARATIASRDDRCRLEGSIPSITGAGCSYYEHRHSRSRSASELPATAAPPASRARTAHGMLFQSGRGHTIPDDYSDALSGRCQRWLSTRTRPVLRRTTHPKRQGTAVGNKRCVGQVSQAEFQSCLQALPFNDHRSWPTLNCTLRGELCVQRPWRKRLSFWTRWSLSSPALQNWSSASTGAPKTAVRSKSSAPIPSTPTACSSAAERTAAATRFIKTSPTERLNAWLGFFVRG